MVRFRVRPSRYEVYGTYCILHVSRTVRSWTYRRHVGGTHPLRRVRSPLSRTAFGSGEEGLSETSYEECQGLEGAWGEARMWLKCCQNVCRWYMWWQHANNLPGRYCMILYDRLWHQEKKEKKLHYSVETSKTIRYLHGVTVFYVVCLRIIYL